MVLLWRIVLFGSSIRILLIGIPYHHNHEGDQKTTRPDFPDIVHGRVHPGGEVSPGQHSACRRHRGMPYQSFYFGAVSTSSKSRGPEMPQTKFICELATRGHKIQK